MRSDPWEAIIVGGGPAGLSAALTLGRCRRRVLVCDTGQPRNRFSNHLHAFLSRDGIAPSELLAIGRDELRQYPSVELRNVEATSVECIPQGFAVQLADGSIEDSRKLLLATGVVDHVPEIEGIGPLYGKSVHHCPYCDAWEWRDQPLAVYARDDEKGSGLALMLTQWSHDIVLLADGPCRLQPDELTRLDSRGIRIIEERVVRLEGSDGKLARVVFDSGRSIERSALFFNTGQHQRSALAAALSCEFDDRGGVVAGDYEVATNVAGLYVAGDITRDVQLVVVAVAEGVKAAFAINKALLAEDGLG